MKRLLKLLIFSSIFGIVSAAGINCPNGQPSSKPTCGTASASCPNNEMCYRNPANEEETLCCDPKFCTDTQMKSYNTRIDDSYMFHMHDVMLRGVWYSRNINGIAATCPIPISALYQLKYAASDIIEKVKTIPEIERLPYNIGDKNHWKDDGSVTLATCSNNQNCEAFTGDGYVGYCYATRNPVYRAPQIDPEQKFCYKLKQLDTKSEYLVDPAKVGPKFCSLHSQCADTYRAGASYDPWFCHKVANTYFNTLTGQAADGLCIRSKACANDEYAVRTASNDNCDPSVADTCAGTGLQTSNPQLHSSCDDVDVGTTKQKLCCYSVSQQVAVSGNKTLTGDGLGQGEKGSKKDQGSGSDTGKKEKEKDKKEEKFGIYEWMCYGGLAGAVVSAILTAVFGVLWLWPSKVSKLFGKKDKKGGKKKKDENQTNETKDGGGANGAVDAPLIQNPDANGGAQNAVDPGAPAAAPPAGGAVNTNQQAEEDKDPITFIDASKQTESEMKPVIPLEVAVAQATMNK